MNTDNYELLRQDKALELIEYFNSDEVIEKSNIKIYLVEKLNNKHYYFHKPSLDKYKVGNDIINTTLFSIKQVLSNKTINRFNPIKRLDEVVDYIPIDEVNGLIILNNDLSKSDKINLNMKELSIPNLCFYMIEVEDGNNNIKLFRRYTNAKTLSKKAKSFSFLNNSLNKTTDEIFFIDNIIDLAILNNRHVLIFNRYSFEVITNYKDNYIDNLNKALDIIEESNLIKNFENFREECVNSISIAKKFTNIMKKDNLRTIKENLPKVPLAIEKANIPILFEDNQLVYRDKSEIYYIIDILSDCFAETLIGSKITNAS